MKSGANFCLVFAIFDSGSVGVGPAQGQQPGTITITSGTQIAASEKGISTWRGRRGVPVSQLKISNRLANRRDSGGGSRCARRLGSANP